MFKFSLSILFKFFSLLIIVLISLFIIFYINHYYLNKKKILGLLPDYIKTDGIIEWSGKDFYENCGVIVFNISTETIINISSDKKFLDGDRDKKTYFSKWKMTPFPSDTFSDGLPYPMDCAKNLSKSLKKQIIIGMVGPNNYYSNTSGNTIIIDMNFGRLFLFYIM